MKVLVVGSGGREHTIIWKLAQSKLVTKLYCAPGNGGIAQLAECVPIDAMDIVGMTAFAQKEAIDLVVVAPDDPLAAGMVDALEAAGVKAFGPSRAAAEIEASKTFSKNLMKKYNIPTAAYASFTDSQEAIAWLQSCKMPIVVKADGLAMGKGVLICSTLKEAQQAVCDMLDGNKFGSAGARVVIEEFMTGPEVSVLAFVDSKTLVPMVSAQDHKRAKDNDEGLNTGGMGTFSPSRIYTPELAEWCMSNVYIPTMEAMNSEGRPFRGILYFGLMITPQGPRVLEYNARFGDPETQVVLPRLKSDLLEIFLAIREERLDQLHIEWEDNSAVCVILASGGYPETYQKGYPIEGIAAAVAIEQVMVFHAGTSVVDGQLITAGGRVLGVTAVDETMELARVRAYQAVQNITFQDAFYRRDIGVK